MINVRKQNKPSYECMLNAELALALCKQAKDSFKEYHCTTGFVFLAFAIEAMFIFYRRQVDSSYNKKDRTSRKDFHKTTMKLCGINNLLGSRDYQIIEKCLKARDSIAHGDFFESDFEYSPTTVDDHDMHVREIVSQSSEQFRNITLKMLEEGIDAAKRIDDLISDNGYKVDEHIDREFMPKLQPAFGVSGLSVW
ncbi:hypothetical protein UXO14_13975 [Enterobacter hormaechei]|nr:hypothetical protein [Enterobacter hormaechei]